VACFALAAVTTPRERLFRGLGSRQVIVLSSGMAGRILGGIAADAVGLRASFALSGALRILAGVVFWIWATEVFVRRPARSESSAPSRPSLLAALRTP